MNERLRELAKQAKKYVDDKWAKEGSPPYPDAHYLFWMSEIQSSPNLLFGNVWNRS